VPPKLPAPTVGQGGPAPPLKPKDSFGWMSVGYPRSESDYDRWFLASFADALMGTLRREGVR
jgi:hypothetical protein